VRAQKAAPPAGALVVLAAAIAWAVQRRRRAHPHGTRLVLHAENAYTRALRALERRGLARGTAETGRELAERAAKANDPGAAAFAELVELYYAARFGAKPVPSSDLDRLSQAVIHPGQP
jgi:hypothetical protein